MGPNVKAVDLFEQREAGGASFEPETTAYLDFIGIPNDGTLFFPATPFETTGADIWTAYNNFVVTLKTNNLYSKVRAMYPRIGGTAATCKTNAINPADTDAAYRVDFSGGWTFSGGGAKPDGLTAYGDSHFNDATDFTAFNNAGIYVYLRDNTLSAGYDAGVYRIPFTQKTVLIARFSDGNSYGALADDAGGTLPVSAPSADSRGLIGVKKNSTHVILTKNGVLTQQVPSTDNSPANGNIHQGAGYNITNNTYAYGDREDAFRAHTDYFDAAEELIWYNAIQALQTGLHRNV